MSQVVRNVVAWGLLVSSLGLVGCTGTGKTVTGKDCVKTSTIAWFPTNSHDFSHDCPHQ